jgi:hypothetical protein
MKRRLNGCFKMVFTGKSAAIIVALTLFVIPLQASFAFSETQATKRVAAAKFTDVTTSHWAYSEIDSLVSKGVVEGYNLKNNLKYFKPETNVTRAEFSKMIALAAKLDTSKVDSNHFLDVEDTHWAFTYVEAAFIADAIDGYGDYTFRPDAKVTRAEIVTMIIKAAKYKINTNTTAPTDLSSSHWAYDYIMTAKRLGIMNGYANGTFVPNGYATRAEACKMILRSLYDVLGEKTSNVTIPTIVINSPTSSSEYTTTLDKISLSGSASDDESISKVTWTNSSGGSGTATGTLSWSISNISLYEGLNTITVTVTDNRNNTSTDKIKVTRNISATTGILAGTIDETPTGSHISGATVRVYKNGVLQGTATTGSNGSYSLTLTASSGYNIVISKTGYNDYSQTGITITASLTTTSNARLSQVTGVMVGSVEDSSTGNDISGAWVEVYSSTMVLLGETSTTAAGSYSLVVPAGSGYTAKFGKVGYATRIINNITVGSGASVVNDIKLELN